MAGIQKLIWLVIIVTSRLVIVFTKMKNALVIIITNLKKINVSSMCPKSPQTSYFRDVELFRTKNGRLVTFITTDISIAIGYVFYSAFHEAIFYEYGTISRVSQESGVARNSTQAARDRPRTLSDVRLARITAGAVTMSSP